MAKEKLRPRCLAMYLGIQTEVWGVGTDLDLHREFLVLTNPLDWVRTSQLRGRGWLFGLAEIFWILFIFRLLPNLIAFIHRHKASEWAPVNYLGSCWCVSYKFLKVKIITVFTISRWLSFSPGTGRDIILTGRTQYKCYYSLSWGPQHQHTDTKHPGTNSYTHTQTTTLPGQEYQTIGHQDNQVPGEVKSHQKNW